MPRSLTPPMPAQAAPCCRRTARAGPSACLSPAYGRPLPTQRQPRTHHAHTHHTAAAASKPTRRNADERARPRATGRPRTACTCTRSKIPLAFHVETHTQQPSPEARQFYNPCRAAMRRTTTVDQATRQAKRISVACESSALTMRHGKTTAHAVAYITHHAHGKQTATLSRTMYDVVMRHAQAQPLHHGKHAHIFAPRQCAHANSEQSAPLLFRLCK